MPMIVFMVKKKEKKKGHGRILCTGKYGLTFKVLNIPRNRQFLHTHASGLWVD
jgi:hypothetical protein